MRWMGNGSVHLKQGDVLGCRRGTLHNWNNRGSEALRDLQFAPDRGRTRCTANGKNSPRDGLRLAPKIAERVLKNHPLRAHSQGATFRFKMKLL